MAGFGPVFVKLVVVFKRSERNPILIPSDRWWESRAVLNPGAVRFGDRLALVYRAVGSDGLSRFGIAFTSDGETIDERRSLPFHESGLKDAEARLGVEDPRLTALNGDVYLTYCKAAVDSAAHPPLSWEPAPFRVRSWIGKTKTFQSLEDVGPILAGVNSKDCVLFPERVNGQFAALIRLYPSIYYVTSSDLRQWSDPREILAPIQGTWEAERVGAGPPPVLTPFGWLLFYHGNAYYDAATNSRRYAMGMVLLDPIVPCQIRYRHPEPVLIPEAAYELHGPVGNVVFGTGLVEMDDRYFLYYGAGDGVIGVAFAEKARVLRELESGLNRP